MKATNIYTVRTDLKNTIAGKVALLAHYREHAAHPDRNDAFKNGINMVISMLEINLEELNKILADVEICCAPPHIHHVRDMPDNFV